MEGHMRLRSLHTGDRLLPAAVLGVSIAVGATTSSCANVITDWDEISVATVITAPPSPPQRLVGMVHIAMFDAVNSIERRYRPYLVQLPADAATSKEAAAAAAAATVLSTVGPKTADDMKTTLVGYLAAIPHGSPKSDGLKLGEAIAARVWAARANDGADAPDAYRPRTTPGVYVPTAITAGSMWPEVKPFAITAASQFRPQPPISLKSRDWATDYNEIKDYGGKNSAKRTAQQTETARFWLMVGPVAYHPFARELVKANRMSVGDSARFMALVAVGLHDSLIALVY